jgi:hypothetical protein
MKKSSVTEVKSSNLVRFQCSCGNERYATDILPPDLCSCGKGWGGAKTKIVKSND